MRTPSHRVRVVHYPVEPGSETTVPIWMAVRPPRKGVPKDAPKILWPVGFGERDPSAIAAANKLRDVSGLPTVGIIIPFAGVVSGVNKIGNIPRALDHLLLGALPFIAAKVAPKRPAYFGGNSLGGGTAAVAAVSGSAEALGVVSPLASNRALGRLVVGRELAVAYRLGYKTTRQNRQLGQEGIGDVIRNGRDDIRQMGLRRFLSAAHYTFSDHTEDMVVTGLEFMQGNERPAAVFSPGDDSCFCPPEYSRLFERLGCGHMIQSAEGPHATMVSALGQAQLALAGEFFREAYVQQAGLSE